MILGGEAGRGFFLEKRVQMSSLTAVWKDTARLSWILRVCGANYHLQPSASAWAAAGGDATHLTVWTLALISPVSYTPLLLSRFTLFLLKKKDYLKNTEITG